MVRLQIKTKRQMSRRDIPVLSYTRDMLKTQDAAGMLDNSFFAADLEDDREYIVMDMREYQRMSPDSQEKMWRMCEEMDIQGDESRQRLDSIVAEYDTSSINAAIDWVQEAFNREENPGEEAFFKQQLQQAESEMEEKGHGSSLEDLLYNEYVCTPLHSEKHRGFDEIPLMDEQELSRIAGQNMPFYIVVDVSKSMLEEERYLFARDIVMKIRQYLLTQKVSDEVRIVIYSDAAVEIEVENDELIRPRASTATGSALRFVSELIEERHSGQSVYIALVTDGEPTTGGEYDQRLWEAQDHAELMAEKLPEKAKLVQFALAPIDPSNTEGFKRYVETIYRLTEKSPYGQTIVLLRKREESLPFLVLSGHQKIKQIQQGLGSGGG